MRGTEPVYIRVATRDIDMVNKIIEAYEGLGVVTTVDRTAGILKVHATPDTKCAVLTVLASLPVPVEFVSA